MIENLIFDWSGTLADDMPSVLSATNRVLQHFGRGGLSIAEFRDKFRLPYTDFYNEVLPEVPLAALQHLYLTHFPSDLAVPIIDHAREFLEYAAATGRRMAVLSSAPLEHVDAQAGNLGVRDFFEHFHCGVLDKREGIRLLLDEMKADAGDTAFIGDMRHDIDAGKAAGVLSIATATGYESVATLMTSEPDVLVPNLSRLPQLLGGWQTRNTAHPIATVGALIQNSRGEVLVIRTHKWRHKWGIPGGKIKLGETSEAALHREIKEETALELAEVQFVLVQDCIEPPEFERPAHFLLMNYLARCLNDDAAVVLNDEAEAFQWLKPAEALKLELNQPTRFLIDESIRRGLLHEYP